MLEELTYNDVSPNDPLFLEKLNQHQENYLSSENVAMIKMREGRTAIPLLEFALGEFVSSTAFKQYFSFQDMLKRLKSFDESQSMQKNLQSKAEMFFFSDQNEGDENQKKKNSKKTDLVVTLFNDFEMKLEFSFKFCHQVYIERLSESEYALYFQLLIPPSIYLF